MALYFTSLLINTAPGVGSILGQGVNGIYVRDKILKYHTSLTYTSTDARFTPIVSNSWPRFFKVRNGFETNYMVIACNVTRTDRPGSPVLPHWTVCSTTKTIGLNNRSITPEYISITETGSNEFSGPAGIFFGAVTNPFPVTVAPDYELPPASGGSMTFVRNSAVETNQADPLIATGKLNLFEFTP